MSFSNEWDERYQNNSHMSIWPWSELVSLVMRYKPQKEIFKVLELGCGAGANIPLFLHLGADYYAIDGSAAIIAKLHMRYPKLQEKIILGDFTKDIPNEKFDLIVDRASLTCNNEKDIINCLIKSHKQLTSGGKYIGVDWYSTKYSEYKKGDKAEDKWTRTNFIDGSFANTGRVHFSDKEHLLKLFKNYKMLYIVHKTLTDEMLESELKLASWNFVAKKS